MRFILSCADILIMIIFGATYVASSKNRHLCFDPFSSSLFCHCRDKSESLCP